MVRTTVNLLGDWWFHRGGSANCLMLVGAPGDVERELYTRMVARSDLTGGRP